MHRRTSSVLFGVTIALLGCSRARTPDIDMGSAPAAPAAPGATAANPAPTAPPAAAPDQVDGTVLETMNSGGYTYAKLGRTTGPVWVAGPETKLAVGAVVAPVQGALMTAFHSDTLNRTFDQIYFIPSFPGADGKPVDPHAGAMPATGTPPVTPAPVGKIDPAEGGQTIAQVFADKAKLGGKPVVVRGQVVKLNEGILGRNWLHIQDGTGAAGTNDLTVTYATGTVAKGDVVVVRGTVALDQDFGAGYKYDVIVENATIAAK
ncbi:MAG: nucleotide-binding protein [Deltaproteobacteria bacterium]|nr:nucleotide-binding protein [Deltaproteobacteria bacterium]